MMSKKGLKMLTPERIALLMLAIVLVVWALLSYIVDLRKPSSIERPIADTLIYTPVDTPAIGTPVAPPPCKDKPSSKSRSHKNQSDQNKSKKGKSGKITSDKNTPPSTHRSHLDEIVTDP